MDFGTNYAAAQPTMARTSKTVPRKTFQKNLDKQDIIKNVVDEILLNKPKKVSAVNYESSEVLEIDYH